MDTGPVEVGREAETAIRWRVRTCEPKSAYPKVRTQKKRLTLEAYRASAPRIQVRPGWNQGRGSEGQRLIRAWGSGRTFAHMFHQPIAFMLQNWKKCLA